MRLFRGKFNAAIWQLPGADRIRRNVFRNEYVVNIKSVGDGENSFKYLAAYTQRGFIGNDRIVKYNGVKVTFQYRDGETNEDRYRTLSAVEFMELYLQHVLPKGVQRIRYGGIWAAAARKRLNAAKEIYSMPSIFFCSSQSGGRPFRNVLSVISFGKVPIIAMWMISGES